MTQMTMVQALNAGLRRAMENDPKVLLMGEDIGPLGGVFRVTDGLHKDFGDLRVIDSPLAESGIVGTAVGLAMRGYRPVLEIQFDGFVFPAFDQIVTMVAKHHYRSGGITRMPMVIRIPYGGGIGAVEHHSESPEAYFAHTPGLRVLTPADAAEAYVTIQQAIASDDPVIYLEPKRRYWDRAEVDEVSAISGSPWTSRVLRRGTDVTIVGYGPMVRTCLEAADAAAEDGVSCSVIDLRSLSPLDLGPVADDVRRTGRCIVVHEAPAVLGIAAEVSAQVSESCFFSLEAPVERVGGAFLPYPPNRYEKHYLPDIDRVLDAIDKVTAL